jgi:uncharacterized membrane protein YeaQ/YmgE (transglycosylase-associated protein family)
METLAAIIAWAVFGLIVGAVARLLVPGRQPMGMLLTMLLGIVGSVAGGMISWIFRGGEPNIYEPAGWIMSTIGAIVVVLLFLRVGRRTE